jgi:SAM-dependent methyltransferase
MEQIRKPFQGVTNIVRFNWHFYLMALLLIILLFFSSGMLNEPFYQYVQYLLFFIVITILISLLVSWYIYDISALYKFDWIDNNVADDNATIININAGFDETSSTLKDKFPNSHLLVFDFYDPERHNEISIKRARKAYSPFPNTLKIDTTQLNQSNNIADVIFLILSAHEIRDPSERIVFFKELKRLLKPSGKIVVTEHLRDVPNFLAYTIGFFHFHSKNNWFNIFRKSELKVSEIKKITPWITTFILEKNGATS